MQNFTLDNAIVYDVETFPNVFTFHAEALNNDWQQTFEISQFCDERQALLNFFDHCNRYQLPMIGFNTVNFDYPVIHYIKNNPNCTVGQIYEFAITIINSFDDRFRNIVCVS